MVSGDKLNDITPVFLRICGIALQLGLLIILIYQFDIVNRGFLHLMILTWFGFIVHALLPLRYRLSLFLVLSLAGILLVLGIETGLWLIGLSLAIIGMSYLPIPYFMRVGLISVTAITLALLRTDYLSVPWSTAIWPLLGSMFMFRMIIYLYDLKHEKTRPGLKWTLSYFFLLPNVCFPLFPVVDYKRFRSNYYNEDDFRIYQRGVNWIFRGIYHLILYRIVYQFGVVDATEVSSTGDLVQYMLSAFFLYLRVSGFFHLVVGILLLFGFNLPETHHRYYFASSFTDFWRRINIYWKDFMVKIFYYPIYFRLKKYGQVRALVVSTITVFFMTWVLHAYQWYWLRGTALFEAHDILFWGILGILVVFNSLYEGKYGRERTFGKQSQSLSNMAAKALRTLFTFTVICILWSLWTSDSLAQWLMLWKQAGPSSSLLVAIIPASIIAAMFFERRAQRGGMHHEKTVKESVRILPSKIGYWSTVAVNSVVILVVVLVASPGFYSHVTADIAGVMDMIKEPGLNKRDKAMLHRGYYEQLIAINNQNATLWEAYNKKPPGWDVLPGETTGGSILDGRVMPNQELVFKGAKFTTNRWGMRDKEYEKNKPDGTYRLALLGSSHVLGSGVSDEQVFERIVENRLNAENKSSPSNSIELLNFSLRGRSAAHHLHTLQNYVLEFQPDVVLHVTHKQDEYMMVNYISKAIRAGREIPFPYIQKIIASEGINKETPDAVIRTRLKRHARNIVNQAEASIAEICIEHGIVPVWLFLPMIDENFDNSEIADRIDEAKKAGFTILTLTGVYDDYSPRKLRVAAWDDHPNELGHKLVAEMLYGELVKRGDILPME